MLYPLYQKCEFLNFGKLYISWNLGTFVKLIYQIIRYGQSPFVVDNKDSDILLTRLVNRLVILYLY